MIHHVFVKSGRTAKEAEHDINEAVANYEDAETEIHFELMIESSIAGAVEETRYTVLIEVSDREEGESTE